MAAFVFTDPRTGIKYSGPDASARWAAYVQGKPFADKGVNRPLPLGPPPVGTYDPAIDYNADASQRGYDQTRDDASTAYEQGQQDLGLAKGDLGRSRDRTLADLLTQRGDVQHQYGILGGQQAEHAAQQGIQSQGLLAKSAAVRGANEAHDLAPIDLQTARTGEDYNRGILGLDLGNARTFGGYDGHLINNPLTGQPAFGSVLTGLTRSAGENNAFQIFSGGQRASQAAANGYTPPTGVLPTVDATKEFLRKQKAKGLIS